VQAQQIGGEARVAGQNIGKKSFNLLLHFLVNKNALLVACAL